MAVPDEDTGRKSVRSVAHAVVAVNNESRTTSVNRLAIKCNSLTFSMLYKMGVVIFAGRIIMDAARRMFCVVIFR